MHACKVCKHSIYNIRKYDPGIRIPGSLQWQNAWALFLRWAFSIFKLATFASRFTN